MPSSRQAARDAWARAKGFASYYNYRDWLAKQIGYASYTEQRKARKTGIGLKGQDVKVKQKIEKTIGGWLKGADLKKLEKIGPADLERLGVDPDWMTLALKELIAKFKAQQHDIRQTLLSTDRSQVIKANRQKILDILKESKTLSDDFYKKELPKIYLQGLRKGAGRQDVTLTEEDMTSIRKAVQTGLANTLRGLQGIGKSSQDVLPKLASPDVTERGRRGLVSREGGRAVVYKDGTRRTYADWAVATAKALTGTAFNVGFIRGASRYQEGADMFVISDGPECGLRSHNDNTPADGLVMKASDALQYPLAHPHCVRSFSVYKGDKKPYETLGQKAKADLMGVARATAAYSVLGTAGETLKTYIAQNDLSTLGQEYLQKVISPRARVFIARMQRVVVPKIDENGLVTGVEKISVEDLAARVAGFQDPFYADNQHLVPEYIKMVVNGNMEHVHEVKWLQNMDRYMEVFDTNFSPKLNILDNFFSQTESGQGFRDSFYDTFTAAISRSQGFGANKYLRFSFPTLTQDLLKLQPPGVRMTWKSLHLRNELTKTVGNLREVSTLNPNGLLRVGFKKSQIGQALTPQLRLVPPGPLHISMTLNRAHEPFWVTSKPDAKHLITPAGRITSLTTRISLTTPRIALRRANKWLGVGENSFVARALQHMGFDIGSAMRMDLRRLGLANLGDIRNLTVDDFRRLMNPNAEDRSPLTGEPARNLFQMVNVITHMRLYGGQFFDMVFTLRLNFRQYAQEARMMWELSHLDAEASGVVFPQSPFRTSLPEKIKTIWRAGLKSTTPGTKPPKSRPPRPKPPKGTPPATVTPIDQGAMAARREGLRRRRPQGGPGPGAAMRFPGKPKPRKKLFTLIHNKKVEKEIRAELEAIYADYRRLPDVQVIAGGGGTEEDSYLMGVYDQGEFGSIIHMNRDVIDRWASHAAERRKFEGTGFVPKGATRSVDTVVHEMGHHVNLSATENQQKDLLSRLVAATGHGLNPIYEEESRKKYLKQVTNDRTFSVEDMEYDMMGWIDMNYSWIGKHVSTYAQTHMGELIAELFLQARIGVDNPLVRVLKVWMKEVHG